MVNAGSAGLPFDFDSRLAYAQLTWQNGEWTAQIIRLHYDLAGAERDFHLTGYLSEAGPLIRLVHIELLQARSQLYQWAVQYQDRAERGEISVAEAVDRFLSHGH